MVSQRKTALVTGASRGIGRAIAIELARNGYDVAITARTLEAGESKWPGTLMETAGQIEKAGQKALPIKADMSREEETSASFDRVMDEWGRLDVLVNNALFMGRAYFAWFVDTPWEALRSMININIVAGLLLVSRAIPVMIKQGGGNLIYITTGDLNPEGRNEALPGQGATGLGYPVTKIPMHRLASALAKEVRQHNIMVTNLMPGAVMTERAEAALSRGVARNDLDFSLLHGPQVPAKAVAHLITHPTECTSAARRWTQRITSSSTVC